VRTSTGTKLFMLAVDVSAIVVGIFGGVWFFDRFS
jgi:hypothetical protein